MTLAVGLVTVLAAAVRLPALRALPIFGDEAIFLRLARIIRAEPLAQLWSPLRAPSAPLHPWLLALSLPVSSDPVRGGRLLSVLWGVLLVPAVAWVTWLLMKTLTRDSPRFAQTTALTAAVLVAASPCLVFSDRLARVDSLFALETALAVGLSVLLATRPSTRAAVLFGLLMGFTMLTRQAVSYPLFVLPLVASLSCSRPERMRLVRALLIAAAVALALWLPMLLAPGPADVGTRVFHLSISRPSLGLADRAALVARNVGIAGAAFWAYLTPPICVLALAGLAIAAAVRRRLFGFLAGWEALVLLPPAVFAIDYFPRYALPAALPLLAGGALAVSLAWIRWGRWFGSLLLAAVVAWGLKDVLTGITDWRRWPLLPIDRRQFVSGWAAGHATEKAAIHLEELSRKAPVWVVLPKISGNPSDGIWLLLDGKPSIRLFYAEDFLTRPVLPPAVSGPVPLQGDIWAGEPVRDVALDSTVPVLFVSTDPVFLGHAGWASASSIVPPRNPGARPLARFENPPEEGGGAASAVVVFGLR